jgi:hypothetical protein
MKRGTNFGRRAFLRAAGGFALALPLLEATHGDSWGKPKNAAPIAKRFIVVFRHGGTASNVQRYEIGKLGDRLDGTGPEQGHDLWAPKDPGETLVLGPIHAALEAHKSKLLLLSGVDNAAGVLQSPYLGDHRWANSTIMTSAKATESTDAAGNQIVLAQGPSLDQVLAQRLSAQNALPFPSVNVMVDGHQYGTPFFSGPARPVNSETNPGKAFDTYLGGVGSGTPNPELVRRQAMGVSVLDGVMDGYKALQPKLSSQDRQVVDAHLTQLSELERRIKTLQTVTCTPITVDHGVQDADAEHVGPIMVDIILAAMRCGLTQVATLELADIITHWLPTPFGDVAFDIGHSLHHVASDCGAKGTQFAKQQQWLDEMVANRGWCIGLFQRLLAGLDSVPEGNGTMLDNTLMLYTSEFSNGSFHSENNMPLLLAGSAGGAFRTGRHLNFNTATDPLAYQSKTGTHNLFTSILNAFGFPDAHFGVDDPGLGFKGPMPGLV